MLNYEPVGRSSNHSHLMKSSDGFRMLTCFNVFLISSFFPSLFFGMICPRWGVDALCNGSLS